MFSVHVMNRFNSPIFIYVQYKERNNIHMGVVCLIRNALLSYNVVEDLVLFAPCFSCQIPLALLLYIVDFSVIIDVPAVH